MDNDKELEMLADRIAEKVLRGGMGERHGSSASNDRLGGGIAAQRRHDEFDPAPPSGPLAKIAETIEAQAANMNEIAHKLNDHADRVFGAYPSEDGPESGGIRAAHPASGYPAIDRIFVALSELDRVHSRVASAAGRNSTLA